MTLHSLLQQLTFVTSTEVVDAIKGLIKLADSLLITEDEAEEQSQVDDELVNKIERVTQELDTAVKGKSFNDFIAINGNVQLSPMLQRNKTKISSWLQLEALSL